MSRERLHGLLLVVTAAAIPVGEGLALGAAGALGLMLLVRRREVRCAALASPPVSPVLAGLGVWLACGFVALAVGGEGWLKPSEMGRWAPLLVLPLVVLSATCLPRIWLGRAAAAFIALLAVACLFGLVQYLFNVRPGEGLARPDLAVFEQGRVPGAIERTVAGGFYFHRLKLAHVSTLGIALLVARQLFGALPLRRRVLELGVFAVMSVALLFTYARAALMAVILAALVALVLASRRVRLMAAAGFVCAALVTAAIPSVRERVVSIGSQEASAVRSLVWSQAVAIVADHPFGIGLGNYPTVVGRYYDAVEPGFRTRTYPHSFWLAAWSETGPLGLCAYVFAFASFLGTCLWRLRASRHAGTRTAAAAGFLGMLTFLVIGLTHDIQSHNAVALAFFSFVGLTLAFLQASASEET